MNQKIESILRWIARIWAALITAAIAFIFIGHVVTEGLGPDFNLTFRESLMMGSFVITSLGLVMGWKWERLGGYLIISGMAAFYLFDVLLSGSFPRGPFFLVIAFPGVLYLLTSLNKDPVSTD